MESHMTSVINIGHDYNEFFWMAFEGRLYGLRGNN